MGGFVVLLCAARHPTDVRGLILQSTMARFDLERLVDGFRAVAGDEVAALARRAYSVEDETDAEWARVFAAFGPNVPDAMALARRVGNPAFDAVSADLIDRLDLVDQLERITVPTLVCVGSLDGVTPVSASHEIADGLRPGVGRLVVLDGGGHFPWLDDPAGYFATIRSFVAELA